jgi:hypothetical protein
MDPPENGDRALRAALLQNRPLRPEAQSAKLDRATLSARGPPANLCPQSRNMSSRSYRLGPPKPTAGQRETNRRIQSLTRSRFALEESAPVLVAEMACVLEGCPPLQTVVVFWTADRTRRRFRMFKPACEVDVDDLPPAWLVEALASFERADGGCC